MEIRQAVPSDLEAVCAIEEACISRDRIMLAVKFRQNRIFYSIQQV